MTISGMFEYQGFWVKVRVIFWKMLIVLPGHQFTFILHSKVNVTKWVKVISR